MTGDESIRDTTEWQSARDSVLKRDQYRCQACGMNESRWRGVDLHVHHIKAVEDGGTNELENLIVVCNKCHNRVHDHGPDDQGEYPTELAEDVTSFYVDTRDTYELKDRDRRFLRVLKENGPTKKEYIKQRGDLAEWEFQKSYQALRFAKCVGRVSRGVYAYIPREEYERVNEEVEAGKPREEIGWGVYDPDEDPREDE